MLGRGKFLCPLRLTKFGGLKASVRGLKLECPWVEIGLSGGRNRKKKGGNVPDTSPSSSVNYAYFQGGKSNLFLFIVSRL